VIHAVRFTPEALNQLDALESHIAGSSSPAIAARYVDAIVDYCENLRIFPQRGTRRDDIRRACGPLDIVGGSRSSSMWQMTA
jgi:plasmid stabilization system protein ParE